MDDIKMNRQLGTKWFTFYTKVRPCFACLMVFSVIADFLQYTDIYVSNWWTLLYFVAAVVQPVLCVIVAVKSCGDYVDFVRFVKGVLLFETINMSYQQGVQQYIKSNFEIGTSLIIFLIMLLISYFVWYRLNVYYFEKRIITSTTNSTYFTANTLQKVSHYEQIVAIPKTDKIRFCRKCGEKLIDNSKFCRKCGTGIVEEPVVFIDETENCEFCKKCGADITNDNDTCHVCGEIIIR